MTTRRFAVVLVRYFIKSNDIARAAYEKFGGILLWTESGVALRELPWKPNHSKPLKGYLPRGLIGHHVILEIPLEEYEHYLHNAQSPLMYQILLKAIISCTQKINKSAVENCLQTDVKKYNGPFYGNHAKWYLEQKFLWLPAPDVLVKKHGDIKIYLDL